VPDPTTNVRAGDTIIAIDREVALTIAECLSPGETPNAFLRAMFNLPAPDNARHSDKWRNEVLRRFGKELQDA
jgi:hypothetical protein